MKIKNSSCFRKKMVYSGYRFRSKVIVFYFAGSIYRFTAIALIIAFYTIVFAFFRKSKRYRF